MGRKKVEPGDGMIGRTVEILSNPFMSKLWQGKRGKVVETVQRDGFTGYKVEVWNDEAKHMNTVFLYEDEFKVVTRA